MKWPVISHQEIIDRNVERLSNSDNELSHLMARALHILPLPPIVRSYSSDEFKDGIGIRSEWSFKQDNEILGKGLSKTAFFWMELGKNERQMTLYSSMLSKSDDEYIEINLTKRAYSDTASISEHNLASRENAIQRVESIIEDMEYGIMRYDESDQAQLYRSLAEAHAVIGSDSSVIKTFEDEAMLEDMEHRLKYGFDL